MRLFKLIGPADDIELIEPQSDDISKPSAVYVNAEYVLLMQGEWGEGTQGIEELELTSERKLEMASIIRKSVTNLDMLDQSEIDALTLLERPTHEQYRVNALLKLDTKYADLMDTLSGNATVEERDTWPIKVAGAKFISNATDAQITEQITLTTSHDPLANDDVEAIIMDIGGDIPALRDEADKILSKSHAYKRLIGMASKIRRIGRDQITVVTSEDQPIEGVGDALDALETDLIDQVNTATMEWVNENAS